MTTMELDQACIDMLETMNGWLDGEPVWPYAKIIEKWGDGFRDWFFRTPADLLRFDDLRMGATLDGMARRSMLRMTWIGAYGFAIPCAELLDELAKSQHVVEIGAGSGYMTRLMRHRGISVTGSNPALQEHGFTVGAYDPAQLKTTGTVMVRAYPGSTVFCSWPTLADGWFFRALRSMQIGQRLVVIREECCADKTAWDYLDDCFEKTARIDIPVFDGMHDHAVACTKRQQRKVIDG